MTHVSSTLFSGIFIRIPLRHHQRRVQDITQPLADDSRQAGRTARVTSGKRLRALIKDIRKKWRKSQVRLVMVKTKPNQHWAGLDNTLNTVDASEKDKALLVRVDAYVRKWLIKQRLYFEYFHQLFEEKRCVKGK